MSKQTKATRLHNVLFNMYQEYKKKQVPGTWVITFDEYKAYKIDMMRSETN